MHIVMQPYQHSKINAKWIRTNDWGEDQSNERHPNPVPFLGEQLPSLQERARIVVAYFTASATAPLPRPGKLGPPSIVPPF